MIMASGPITSWQIHGEKVKAVTNFTFLGSKFTADSESSHENKRHLLLGRKAMSILNKCIKKQRHHFADKGPHSQVLVTQSCPTLCDPIDCSLPRYTIYGILQARVLEWVPIPFSRGSSWPRDRTRSPTLQGDSFLSELPRKPKVLFSQ